MYASEIDFATKVLERLENSHGVLARREVPILGRIADLAYKIGDALFTVEFKLHDWRRAIEQARDHRLVADYAYICMPKRTISEKMRDSLRVAKVGLCFYDDEANWPFEIAIEAPRSDETWAVARADVIDLLEETRE